MRRILFGSRLTSEEEEGERLSKKTGLAILASDNISSSAYATEEAMRVLAIAGTAALALTMPIAIAVCVVLAVVILSESRVIRAYPNGGGSYIVAKDNHGVIPGLIAAAALLIDYVLTVAVSSAAGVAAISSFVPAVHDHRVLWAIGLIVLLTIGNLRGIREAGVIFAAPTYVYVVSLLGLIALRSVPHRHRRSAGCGRAARRIRGHWARDADPAHRPTCLRVGLGRSHRQRGDRERRPQLQAA